MKKVAILAAVMSFAVFGTAFAGPNHGGPPPGHRPGGPVVVRRHMPPPPHYHHRRVYKPHSNALFDLSLALVYKHIDMAYNDAYAAAYVLARGFHKDHAANRLVASAGALTDIRDDYGSKQVLRDMAMCVPTDSEITYMVNNHREYLKEVMLDAKAYQHSCNRNFGWLTAGTIMMVLTCPKERKDELLAAIAYGVERGTETKRIFNAFSNSFKTIKGLVTPAELKEAAKRGNELKKLQEQGYGF